MQILYFEDYIGPANRLAEALGCNAREILRHRFPDGESCLTLPSPLSGDVLICQTLDQPNAKLVELILAAHTARRLGAQRVLLVAPYLCYMRQDVAFEPGQAISQGIIGGLLAETFDGVFTVDAHLHRINHLSEAIHKGIACNIIASTTIAQFIATQYPTAVLIGPDSESEQWVAQAAGSVGLQYAIASKTRRGDRDVSVELPPMDLVNRDVVIVDDIVSSAHTAIEAAKVARARGASRIAIACTHALLAPGARALIEEQAIDALWSCDSVLDTSNAITLASPLAAAIKQAL
jgi:ribose-phosphate pyrophosphokinase